MSEPEFHSTLVRAAAHCALNGDISLARDVIVLAGLLRALVIFSPGDQGATPPGSSPEPTASPTGPPPSGGTPGEKHLTLAKEQ
jgi:hypothetical protein